MTATPRPSAGSARSDAKAPGYGHGRLLGVLTAGALLWSALILATPGWRARDGDGVARVSGVTADVVRLVASRVCHQRPDRSFHLHGVPMPVCGRCTGLYVSGALGLLAAALAPPRAGRARQRAGAPLRSATDRVQVSAGFSRVALDRGAVWLAFAGIPTVVTWALEIVGVWDPGTMVRAFAALPLGAAAGWLVARALQQRRHEGEPPALATLPG